MKKTLLLILFVFPFFFSLQAQIQNGGFEYWSGLDPVGWYTGNNNPLNIVTITQSTDSHSGNFAVKGTVVPYQNYTFSPGLAAGSDNGQGFPYTGRPKKIRGYYKFFPVGGDGLQIVAGLWENNTIIATNVTQIFTPTDSTGYQELDLPFIYLDTTIIPTKITIIFSIIPAGQYANAGTTFYVDDFPSVLLIKPPQSSSENILDEQPVFISGETDTIKWDNGGSEYVDLKYSTDDGETFTDIDFKYPADSNKYYWHVPSDLLSRKGRVKIIDSFSQSETKSIKVSFKPWQLTRINAEEEFDLFKPNHDGWSFANSSPNMWPQYWWQQFIYQLGSDPYTGSLYPFREPFQTASSSDFPDWPLIVYAYETQQCYRDSPPTRYNSGATRLWDLINHNWNGSCFGFAVTSLLGFYHMNAFVNKFPAIGYFGALINVPLNDSTRKVINRFYTYQFSTEYVQYINQHDNDSPRQLLQNLKNMFKKENGDGKILGFFNNRGKGGHAVTPYKMERLGNTSTFNVRLYDSRAPGSTNSIIFIDSTNNTWADATGLNWGSGSKNCFLFPDSYHFFSRPTMWPKNFGEHSSKIINSGLSNLLIFNTSNANILITSNSGNQIGIQDSIIIDDIANGNPITKLNGSEDPPIGYFLPHDNYSIIMNDFIDSTSYIDFFSDSTIYHYKRIGVQNNESDLFNYSDNGIKIINQDPTIKNTDFETILLDDTTIEKVFALNNLKVTSGDSLNLIQKDRNKLMMQNYGSNFIYDLQVRYENNSIENDFSHYSIPIDNYSAHYIVPNWNDLENDPVKILIDLGNDGSIDDSLFLNNQILNVENHNSPIVPKVYKLYQNYPNPFNNSSVIKYSIPKTTHVTLTVYDELGRKVTTLVNETKHTGTYKINFKGDNLASGIYFYRIQAGSFSETKKMILLK